MPAFEMCDESSCPCRLVLPEEVKDLLREYPSLNECFALAARSAFVHGICAAADVLRLGASEYEKSKSRTIAEIGSEVLQIEERILREKAAEVRSLPWSVFQCGEDN